MLTRSSKVFPGVHFCAGGVVLDTNFAQGTAFDYLKRNSSDGWRGGGWQCLHLELNDA